MIKLAQQRAYWLVGSHLAVAAAAAASWEAARSWGFWGGVAAFAASLSMAAVVTRFHLAAWVNPFHRICHQISGLGPRTLRTRLTATGDDPAQQRVVLEVNGLLDRLEPCFADMGEYAAKVAHELRTPLTVLRVKLENPQRQIDPVLAEQLQDELARLTHIVDQSLLVAKAERGRLTIKLERFDLGQVVEGVFADFAPLFADRRRRLSWRSDAGLLIEADKRHVRQLVHNLLSNALLHGSGDVVERTTLSGQGRVKLVLVNEVAELPRRRVDLNLGLGLKVVQSLVTAQPGARLRRHSGSKWHAVLLSLPFAPSVGGGAQAPREREEASPSLVPGLASSPVTV